MGIARSTCYHAPKGFADDTALVEAMHAIKDEFEAYGWRRMQAALRHRGWIVNHRKIKRLMREHAMHPPCRRRFVATTDSDHDEPVFPDRLLFRTLFDGGFSRLFRAVDVHISHIILALPDRGTAFDDVFSARLMKARGDRFARLVGM